MPETTKRFSFKYEGPIAPVDDGNCDICIAIATKKCRKGKGAHEVIPPLTPEAGKTMTETVARMAKDMRDHCPSCVVERRIAEGKPVHCPNHAGLSAALEQHKGDHADHHAAAFDAFAKDVLEHVAEVGKAHTGVVVQGGGFVDPRLENGEPDLTLPFAKYRVDVTVPRHEDPPRG